MRSISLMAMWTPARFWQVHLFMQRFYIWVSIAYDVTVMDDLALGGASLLSAHYVPVYLKQSCWHKFVDAAKTDP